MGHFVVDEHVACDYLENMYRYKEYFFLLIRQRQATRVNFEISRENFGAARFWSSLTWPHRARQA
jgi:hypothetical protein